MPAAYYLPFLFVLGLCVGSFLNACIYRLPRGISLAAPPSHCPACGARLKPLDLIPVLSYLFLRGRCRHCGRAISPRYPLVEVLTGTGFLLIGWKYGLNLPAAAQLVFFTVLVAAAFIDLEHRIIPDRLNFFALGAGVILVALQGTGALKDGLLGAILAGGLLFFVALLSRGGMGGGDVKLALVMGLYLGWQKVIVALFFSFLLGAAAGLLWVYATRQNLKAVVPFGPFLAAGSFLAVMAGEEVISWYVSFLP
ncbi:prepilin peptidase [Desulfovirgula thermocuniculi]|uniref:prepilin peptidase n=1 Tax=Desulfovirgula thermocuniculi TaxID=348842 RepID=UPI00040C6CB7|nr:A24 family peptidase [Desulfovirgula thermocuniculi]